MCTLWHACCCIAVVIKSSEGDLEQQDFKFNPYDACAANKEVKGNQLSVCFHVDDLISKHIDSKVNDIFANWLNRMYAKHGAVSVNHGRVQDYLVMVFDFSKSSTVMVSICMQYQLFTALLLCCVQESRSPTIMIEPN